jgi:hypothetical protein
MEEMMILRNKIKIKELNPIAMQRELRIHERMRGKRDRMGVQHRHPIILFITWEWLQIQ